jgi:hypothetical protein
MPRADPLGFSRLRSRTIASKQSAKRFTRYMAKHPPGPAMTLGKMRALDELTKLAVNTKRERRGLKPLRADLTPHVSLVLRRRDKNDTIFVTGRRFEKAIQDLIDRGYMTRAGSDNTYVLTSVGIYTCNRLGYRGKT